MTQFRHEIVAAGEWRRIGTHGRENKEGLHNSRPHLIPETVGAMSFVGLVAFGPMGTGGLCPGEVLVNGEWIGAFRFIDLPPESVDKIVADIQVEMERISEKETVL